MSDVTVVPPKTTEQLMAEMREVKGFVRLSTYDVVDGFVRNEVGRTEEEVLDEINNLMKEYFDEYCFQGNFDREARQNPVPFDARIVVFAVPGGSEGHYIHVGFLQRSEDGKQIVYQELGLAKTFKGMEYASALAGLATRLLMGE